MHAYNYVHALYNDYFVCSLLTILASMSKKNINLFYFFNSGRALYNRAGCKTVRAGRCALRNMPSWNTDYSDRPTAAIGDLL